MADLRRQTPPFRRVRVYAFDPSLSLDIATAGLNELTMKIPWETSPATCPAPTVFKDFLQPGPVGEYLEVVDVDPASENFYHPVDLNDPYLLAQDGLPPSEGNPQFHQQMVYAVCMNTIRHFEKALGRKALWSPRPWNQVKNFPRPKGERLDYVPRLRLYPHALRQANAYYSPDKKAILFGYFPASFDNPGRNLPGGTVFTCLSQDIIAHETTHALLDGMHRRYVLDTNPDVLAFHEAFADIVALFQHFSFPEVLRHQIAKTRGDLESQSLLGQLAQQFGQAIGSYGALRDAIGQTDAKGNWTRKPPDPTALQQADEPHKRGSILVAAVFQAFLSIYKARIVDLLRIASNGTGILPDGELHPDLVNRLAQEAAEAAQHILTMCIRALDYCPPVDITFGEYLRALITADYDLVRDDDLHYRVAVIDAFRQWGIYPEGVRTLSVESLLWQRPNDEDATLLQDILNYEVEVEVELPEERPIKVSRPTSASTTEDSQAAIERRKSGRETVWNEIMENARAWNMACDRYAAYIAMKRSCRILHELLKLSVPAETPSQVPTEINAMFGVDFQNPFEVHSARPARRIGPDGQSSLELIAEIVQTGSIDPETLPEDRSFTGGCTLIIDMESRAVRYCIRKSITTLARRKAQQGYQNRADTSLRAVYFSQPNAEMFAALHMTPIGE